jgi:hypothetical protein
VPAGGFAPGRTQWVRPKRAGFFLPKGVLSEVFRGKFTDAFKGLFRRKKLAFHGSLAWFCQIGVLITHTIRESKIQDFIRRNDAHDWR